MSGGGLQPCFGEADVCGYEVADESQYCRTKYIVVVYIMPRGVSDKFCVYISC